VSPPGANGQDPGPGADAGRPPMPEVPVGRDAADRGQLVLGVDAGATATWALLATADGQAVGRGRAGGANVRSSTGRPAEALAAALGQALGDRDPAAVAWAAAGLPGRPVVTDDIAVAFAAGSPAPDGLVLIAGTGAGAAAVHGGRVVRRADGCGWLLGDEGSAVWLGLAGARAALAATDGRGPATALTRLVSEALLGGPGPAEPMEFAQAVIGAGDRLHPAELGRLAPLVAEAAAGGDQVAAGLVEAAAEKLLNTLDAVAGEDGAVVVLAGALLDPDGVVGRLVADGVGKRWPGSVVERAGAGEGGAAWLALRLLHDRLGGDGPDRSVHRRLVTTTAGAGRVAGR
jgi:glucosamine kinase